jgi:hypothetical protein
LIYYSYPSVVSESDKAFELYLNNACKINGLYNEKGLVEEALTGIIFKAEVAPKFLDKTGVIPFDIVVSNLITKYSGLDKTSFRIQLERWFSGTLGQEIYKEVKGREIQSEDWDRIGQKLKRRFPGHDCGQVLMKIEARYYNEREAWEECAKVAIDLINRYGRQMGDMDINNIVWDCIFEHSMDREILNKASKYMTQIVKKTPNNVRYIDTYANLLYKTGHNEEAIGLEIRVIHLSELSGGVPGVYTETLEKMKKGEPTWRRKTTGS